jgi:cardiolipin synthase
VSVVHTGGELELLPGNRVELLRDGNEALPAIFSAIRRARRYVHLEYYVFEDVHCQGETLSELLIRVRGEGVQVAVIYDAVGSSRTPSSFLERLERVGVRLLSFNPINPLQTRRGWLPGWRDHRKILIVDGSLAIVGGINLSATYERRPLTRGTLAHRDRGINAPWRDTDLKLEGPAVAQLQQLFLEQWALQNGGTLPDVDVFPAHSPGTERVGVLGSSPRRGRPRYYTALLAALRAAESRIWITAGYFLPTAEQKNALVEAARRRVDVQLLLPAHNDSLAALAVQRFAYTELLEAGVRIYERLGVILHAKSVIVDASWSAVGSSNFDQRSARSNDEVDVVVIGGETAEALARLFIADIQHGRLIEPRCWHRRSLGQRAMEVFFKPWEGLL